MLRIFYYLIVTIFISLGADAYAATSNTHEKKQVKAKPAPKAPSKSAQKPKVQKVKAASAAVKKDVLVEKQTKKAAVEKQTKKVAVEKSGSKKADRGKKTTAPASKALTAKAAPPSEVQDDSDVSEMKEVDHDSSVPLLLSFLMFVAVGGGGLWFYLRNKQVATPNMGLGDTPPFSTQQDEVFGSNLASLDLPDAQQDGAKKVGR